MEPDTVIAKLPARTRNGFTCIRPSRISMDDRMAFSVGLPRSGSFRTSASRCISGNPSSATREVRREPFPFNTSNSGVMSRLRAPLMSRFAEKAPCAKRATGASVRTVRNAADAPAMSRLSSASPTPKVGRSTSVVS